MNGDALYNMIVAAVRANSISATDSANPADIAAMMSRSFEELDFDSLNFMEFCIAVSVETGVNLSVAQVTSLKTPLAVFQHLSGRGNPTPPPAADSPPADTSFRQAVLRALAACRAETDYYRVFVEIERVATPADVEFLAETDGPWASHFKEALGKLLQNMRQVRPTPSAHTLTPINRSVLLYSNPARKRRRLIVGFAGVLGVLFVPTPLILQYFPVGTDVLLLHDPARVGFGGGISGYAESFPAIFPRLKQDVDFRRYLSVNCIGMSAGGCGALAAGVLLGADKAISCSGRLPSRALRAPSRLVPQHIESVLRTSGGDPARFFSVFGAENAKDVANSKAIAEVFRLTQIPVAGVRDHNVIQQLHLNGALDAFLGGLDLNT